MHQPVKKGIIEARKGAAKIFEKSQDMRVKIVDIYSLIPKEDLLRKIDKVMDFDEIYAITKKYLR